MVLFISRFSKLCWFWCLEWFMVFSVGVGILFWSFLLFGNFLSRAVLGLVVLQFGFVSYLLV